MNNLKDKLLIEYPELIYLSKNYSNTPYNLFGIEVNIGWYKIISNALINISKIDKYQTVMIDQIKEKFGGLRIYYSLNYEKQSLLEQDEINNLYKQIDNIIKNAEHEAYKTCERCGSIENVESKGIYILTLCNSCRQKG